MLSPVGHLVLDRTGTCRWANPALEALLGEVGSSVVGRSWTSWLHEDEPAVEPRPGLVLEQRLHPPGGGVRTVVVEATTLDDGHDLVSVQDVTARKAAEEGMTHAALHDAMTGLPNRRLLHDRLDTALSRGRRNQHGRPVASDEPQGTVAVVFLDLDGFKEINDAHGHETGDAILVAVAANLQAGMRSCDTVARLGGDEFVVVCEDMATGGHASEDSLLGLTDRVHRAVGQPVDARGVRAQVTASLGVALATSSTRTPQDLLRAADHAMYRAKRDAGVRYVVAEG